MLKLIIVAMLSNWPGVTFAQWELPDFNFMLKISRGKTYITSSTETCGKEIWTNTATGLVVLLQKGVNGADCGAPKVDTFQCDRDREPKKCHFCRRNTDELCGDASFDPTRPIVICANGDFEVGGLRYTPYPFSEERAREACAP